MQTNQPRHRIRCLCRQLTLLYARSSSISMLCSTAANCCFIHSSSDQSASICLFGGFSAVLGVFLADSFLGNGAGDCVWAIGDSTPFCLFGAFSAVLRAFLAASFLGDGAGACVWASGDFTPFCSAALFLSLLGNLTWFCSVVFVLPGDFTPLCSDAPCLFSARRLDQVRLCCLILLLSRRLYMVLFCCLLAWKQRREASARGGTESA